MAAIDLPTGNGSADPFTTSPARQPTTVRYAGFDNEDFSLYSSASPSHARRALEAHLKDTDRRIQDASKLGTTLLQQRKELSARLKDVEQLDKDNEVPESLRQKLADIEKEYDAIGKESARAFLPKSRNVSEGAEKVVLSASGRESPTKLSAPSRKQRNQPTNRIHDIEFATEISTSLLAQVRQLQAALVEKDDALKASNSVTANLESELEATTQRIRRLDESEQRYKDENWNLETRLQEIEASIKESTDREHRLGQSLKSTESEKSAAQRELDSLKLSHDQLSEQHALIKKQQESDMHGLRRDLSSHQSEREQLQKRIAELTAQNTELAKAVSYRFGQPSQASEHEFVTADEEDNDADVTPDHSEPVSPVKGTPRHGMLESETLKSSLNHAHRMIQNLKNNIHREKTEKIELKRMLQDARDELENRRGDGANVAKKRRSEPQFKKPNRPDRLGAPRTGTTDIFDDEDWEDDAGARTPSKSTFGGAALVGGLTAAGGAAVFAHRSEPDSTDAFETATERGGTTESEAFETGNEGPAVDDSDELTETEGTVNRSGPVKQSTSSLNNAKAGDRSSFLSTASTSADEAGEPDYDATRTPAQGQQQRYRLRMARGGKRGGRVADLMSDSPSTIGNHSPSSSFGGTPQPAGQSLGDELDALDDESTEGTPSRFSASATASPETSRQVTAEPDTPRTLDSPFKNSIASDRVVSVLHSPSPIKEKPSMVDTGIMTEPWEPERIIINEPAAVTTTEAAAPENEHALSSEPGKMTPERTSFRNRAGEVMGGALAGFGLGRLGRSKERGSTDIASRGQTPEPQADSTHSMAVVAANEAMGTTASANPISFTEVDSSATEARESEAGLASDKAAHVNLPTAALSFSSIESQEYESTPVRSVEPVPSVAAIPPTEPAAPIPGTDAARPGASLVAASAFGSANSLEENARTQEPAGGTKSSRAPLGELQPNVAQNTAAVPIVSTTKKPMADEGVQTLVSGNDIEKMLSARPTVDAAASPIRAPTTLPESGINEPVSPKVPRRPGSASSMRKTPVIVPPPLPEDHTQKIAQAQRDPPLASAGAMGPPGMPASAYRQANRPRTPGERASERTSKDGTTPRPPRMGRTQASSMSNMSRRSSVSSFASEIDQRFNRGQFMYPADVEPTTDPRMIQAITQTMIGEYLWKYTRKAGRSETSSSRHRRFFWVHPYTRTLYWSETDPSAAGKNMLKAKSVAIEAVRVITDDNTMPPGLHRKSIVIITPGREIVFTAPTGQRHETWYNALSYLLLRSDREKAEAADKLNEEDISEFNPSFSFRRSISKMTGRDRSTSRMSMSSYNSRTTRTSSPQRAALGSAGAAGAANGSNAAGAPSEGRQASGAFSSIASKFRPGSAHQRGSVNPASRGRSSTSLARRAGDPAEIYDASVVADSAEDLRAVIERQEQEAERLENVRACCDGKHDVGSLPNRKGRHNSFGNRLSSQVHSHAGPSDSPRSRT